MKYLKLIALILFSLQNFERSTKKNLRCVLLKAQKSGFILPITDEEKCHKMENLIIDLTMSGSTTLDENKMKETKKMCK